MHGTTLILLLAGMAFVSFMLGRRRSLVVVGGPAKGTALHSLPGYYGYFTMIWCLLPALALLALWVILEPRVIVALVIGQLHAGDPGREELVADGKDHRADEEAHHPDAEHPRVRVGIATGPTVVGDVLATGASERSELVALGPTPNLAARVQAQAAPGTVNA